MRGLGGSGSPSLDGSSSGGKDSHFIVDGVVLTERGMMTLKAQTLEKADGKLGLVLVWMHPWPYF